MQRVGGSLWNRPDTLFGVCEGLGQDFGFNPIYLRIALAASILWDPRIAIGGYLVLGLFVAASRLLFPNPRVAEVRDATPVPAPEPQPRTAPQEEAPVLAEAA